MKPSTMTVRSLTIGEVASQVGMTAQAIRFYEREGLLPKPHRSYTGYRLYDSEILARLRFIKQARRLGLSLGEIKEILKMTRAGRAPCCRVRELLGHKLKELDDQLAELTHFREELNEFINKIAKMPDQADVSSSVCALIEIATLAKGSDAATLPRRKTHGKGDD